MTVGIGVGFPFVSAGRASDTIWAAVFANKPAGALAVFPGGLALASGPAAERTVQVNDAQLVTGITQNHGRIGRQATAHLLALVVEEQRVNVWPTPRDIESVGSPTVGTGSAATYSASGVVGPDGTGTPKFLEVLSAGYSRYLSTSGADTRYTYSAWLRALFGTSSNQTLVGGTVPGFSTVNDNGTLTTSWRRRRGTTRVNETARNVVPSDGRDWVTYGGMTAGNRQAVFDFVQVENGAFATEAIPTTTTRTAEYLSRTTSGMGGQIRLEFRIRPKGARHEYTGAPRLYSFQTSSDQVYFTPSTGIITVITGGVGFDTVSGATWAAGDTVDFWIVSGGSQPTEVRYRVNGGTPVTLGTSLTNLPNSIGSGTFYLLNNKATSDVFTCYVEAIRVYKPDKTPAWALVYSGIPLEGRVLWWQDPRVAPPGLVSSLPSRIGTFTPTAAGALRPTADGVSIEFDGVDDALQLIASAATNPSGATKFTVAFWIRPDTVAVTFVPLETGFYPNGILVQSTPTGLNLFVGALNCQLPVLTAGVWQFVAFTCDLSRPINTRARGFRGEPTVVEQTLAYDNIAVTTVPVAAGMSGIGGRSTVYFDGRLSSVLVWIGVELTAAELQEVADATNI